MLIVRHAVGRYSCKNGSRKGTRGRQVACLREGGEGGGERVLVNKYHRDSWNVPVIRPSPVLSAC